MLNRNIDQQINRISKHFIFGEKKKNPTESDYGNPEFMMSADLQTDRYSSMEFLELVCVRLKFPEVDRAGILFFYYSIKITGAAASTYSSTDTEGN